MTLIDQRNRRKVKETKNKNSSKLKNNFSTEDVVYN